MAKNKAPKKENPLVVGILMTIGGIVISFFGKGNDLMLFNSIRLDGRIAFPVLGILVAVIGIFKILEFIKSKKQ